MATPQNPKGLSLSVEAVTKNTKIIEVNIFHAEDANGATYYQIYAKREPFTEADLALPNNKYKIAAVSFPNSVFRYIPAYDYVWYFRVVAFNGSAQFSSPVSSFVNVGDVHPVLDFSIENTYVTEAQHSYEGLRAVEKYTNPEPDLVWTPNFLFKESAEIINDLLGQFGYRITVREKSINGSTPNRKVFLEITGHKSTNFTFDVFSNISGFGGYEGSALYPEFARRNYDICIEAHDDEGFSSAGGNFASGDSFVNYSNPQGFKVLGLENESVLAPALSGENSYITIDNFIKLVNLPQDTPDISGYYVFASTNPFQTSDIKDASAEGLRARGIDVLDITPNETTREIKPNLEDLKLADTAYVAVAYYDKFDKFIFDLSNRYGGKLAADQSAYYGPTHLNISNVLQVSKISNAIKESISEGFKVWIRINEHGEWMGNGVKCVKEIDLNSEDAPASYRSYKGFVPYSCYSKDAGGFNDLHCGYGYDPDKLKGGDRQDIKKGFKRYRVYFTDSFIQPDSNYAVIGLNASNAPYPKVDDLFDSFGVDTLASIGLKDAFDSYKASAELQDIYFGDGPAYYKHHPAGFGQGFGGLEKSKDYFDIHMGHLIDMSYLKEGYFAIVTNTAGNFFARAKNWTEECK